MLISFELICILFNSLISYSSYNPGNSNSTKENEKQLELRGGGGVIRVDCNFQFAMIKIDSCFFYSTSVYGAMKI